MSRIGKAPIVIPNNIININIFNNYIEIKGILGTLTYNVPNYINIYYYKKKIFFFLKKKNRKFNIMLGTIRSLIKNMIQGVTKGFEKKLILVGVGFKAKLKNNKLYLYVGYSHLVKYLIPNYITCKVLNKIEILLFGIDYQKIGQIAANIRSIRPPEPYKGKGIRYSNEFIKLKEIKKK